MIPQHCFIGRCWTHEHTHATPVKQTTIFLCIRKAQNDIGGATCWWLRLPQFFQLGEEAEVGKNTVLLGAGSPLVFRRGPEAHFGQVHSQRALTVKMRQMRWDQQYTEPLPKRRRRKRREIHPRLRYQQPGTRDEEMPVWNHGCPQTSFSPTGMIVFYCRYTPPVLMYLTHASEVEILSRPRSQV